MTWSEEDIEGRFVGLSAHYHAINSLIGNEQPSVAWFKQLLNEYRDALEQVVQERHNNKKNITILSELSEESSASPSDSLHTVIRDLEQKAADSQSPGDVSTYTDMITGALKLHQQQNHDAMEYMEKLDTIRFRRRIEGMQAVGSRSEALAERHRITRLLSIIGLPGHDYFHTKGEK